MAQTATQIPTDVKRQKEATDAIYAEIDKAAAADAGTPAEPAPGEAADPNAQPEAGEGTPDQSAPEPTGDVAELTKQVESLSAALTNLQNEHSTALHKIEVLDGKLKVEGPRSAQQIKDLKAEVDRLTGLLAGKGTDISAKSPEAGDLDEEDRQIMDATGLDEATYKRMRSKFGGGQAPAPAAQQPAATTTTPEVEPEAPEAVQSEAGMTAYNTLLDVKAAGWRKAKDLPEFMQFLETAMESTTGRSLFDILIDADRQRDADTVARVYQAFFKKVRPAAAAQAPQKPTREAASSSSKGGSSLAETPKIWTPEQITQFSNDVAQGRIKRGSDEYKRLKDSLDAFQDNIRIV